MLRGSYSTQMKQSVGKLQLICAIHLRAILILNECLKIVIFKLFPYHTTHERFQRIILRSKFSPSGTTTVSNFSLCVKSISRIPSSFQNYELIIPSTNLPIMYADTAHAPPSKKDSMPERN